MKDAASHRLMGVSTGSNSRCVARVGDVRVRERQIRGAFWGFMGPARC